MPPGDVIQIRELLFVGLLAGLEIGVHYGIGAPPSTLPENAQILLRQAMVRRLRILAPAIFLPSLVSAVALAVLQRRAAEPGLLYLTIGMLLVWIVVRIIRTVPVNSATLEWNPEAPPKDWRSRLERTERFHVVATWAAVMAFLSSLVAAFRTN